MSFLKSPSMFFDNLFKSGHSSKSYVNHLAPAEHEVPRRLDFTYMECSTWIGRRVIVSLRRFEFPQLGTVRYIGNDPKGLLCAGIEFDVNIQGMSGKVNNQKLFKCKPNHGLIVPVDRFILLENENRTSSQNSSDTSGRRSSTSQTMTRAKSVPNLASSRSHLNDFIEETLPGLQNGDTVVWLGQGNPISGVVRWIGRAGHGKPLKAWVEMDEFVGYGEESYALGPQFGCEKGHGKCVPVDELMLLQNFLPSHTQLQNPDPGKPVSECREGTLISLADDDPKMTTETNQGQFKYPLDVNEIVTDFNHLSVKEPELLQQIPLWLNGACPSKGQYDERETDTGRPQESAAVTCITFHELESKQSGEKAVAKRTDRDVQQHQHFSIEPFILPPINIVDFGQKKGWKGIQGRRNSCYADVVLFPMFAFTNIFDSRFLSKTDRFQTTPDTLMTERVRDIMIGEIVNPLRQHYYISATGVTKMREVMTPLSSKLDGAFMDVEEFLHLLFVVFNLKEFINYDTNVNDFLHQINLSGIQLPSVITVQDSFSLSLSEYGLKLKGLPTPALILQLPRNHADLIQQTIFVPNLTLNLRNDVLELPPGVPPVMHLLAVICINDFHFTTFVKCGEGALSHWVFFDSSPSTEKPKVEILPEMGEWLESLENTAREAPFLIVEEKHKYPHMLKRLLSDIYVCIYYSPAAVLHETIHHS